MHYSIKNILFKEELDYFINYFYSNERFVTNGMEKLLMPKDDLIFMSYIDNFIKTKLHIDNFKIVGDNFYKHSNSYYPHCDATDEKAWLNIVVPLERYTVSGQQNFIVFDQQWLGTPTTWMGKVQMQGDYVSNKKSNTRPCDSELFSLGTNKELPNNIWTEINEYKFDKDYFFSMSGELHEWEPGNIIVFDSKHIHATGKMKSGSKLGLSIRIENQ